MVSAKSLLRRKRMEKYINAIERASSAQEALDIYLTELNRRDLKLRRLLAESNAAEEQITKLRV